MEILLNYELLKLLKEYEKKGLLADEDFIKTAAKIILEKRRCQREVDDIVIGENAILFEIPMFDENSKTLYIKSGMDKKRVVENFFNKSDTINIYNLKVLTYILEVCNEICQKAKKHNDVTSYLIYLHEHFKTTAIDLCSRMARIDAVNQISNLANWLSIKDKETLENYINYEIVSALLQGYSYEKGILRCPVFKYLNKYNLHLANEGRNVDTEEELMYKINAATTNNTLDENLYIGFPIDEDNYKDLASQKENTAKLLLRKRN